MTRSNPNPPIELEQASKMFDSLITDYNRLKCINKSVQPIAQISSECKQILASIIDKIQQIFLLFHNNVKCENKVFYEDDTFLLKKNEVKILIIKFLIFIA